jgi:hypothetical protein
MSSIDDLMKAAHAVNMPTGAAERKAVPIFSGFLRYFPKATAAVAELSRIGNDQHNPGKPLHWDRTKSTDELDALMRHLADAGTFDVDRVRHSTKVAWRAMANLEKELEAAGNVTLAPSVDRAILNDLADMAPNRMEASQETPQEKFERLSRPGRVRPDLSGL